MRIETTLRAGFIIESADGELKEWLTEALVRLKAGQEIPAQAFPAEPNVFLSRFKDYGLVFKRDKDTVEIQDILNLQLVLQCLK